ncbi:MAG TPA: UrcA family protein, partial [Sphingomicrobium sp.]|nr:UrcA family protein [Sphingomicrobium sp.]
MTKLFIATLLVFSAAPALAEQPATATAKVQVADLDLSTAAGQRALNRRLTVAAKEVCG